MNPTITDPYDFKEGDRVAFTFAGRHFDTTLVQENGPDGTRLRAATSPAGGFRPFVIDRRPGGGLEVAYGISNLRLVEEDLPEYDGVWVEVDNDTFFDLPDGVRVRKEWVVGKVGRRFVHRDDLPNPARDAVSDILEGYDARVPLDDFFTSLHAAGFDVVPKETR